MKRITALLLSALVLISSMTCMLLMPANALTPYQIEAYFENPENWMLDAENATNIADASTTTWTSIASSTVTVGGETVDAIKLHTMNHRASIYLPNLKKNTEYTFSFRYYSTALNSNGYIFKDVVFFTPDFTDAVIAWNYNTPNGVKEYVSHNGYYKWNDDYSDATENWDVSATTKNAVAGEWNTMTFTFNTGAYDTYAPVLLSKVDDVYLDQFTLTEKEVTTEAYFMNPANWHLDYENADYIGDPDHPQSSWAYVDNSTYTVGGQAADVLRFHAQNHDASIPLPNLKKNTEYTFSFRYTSNQVGKQQSTYECIFKDAILFTPSFTNAKIAWNTETANGVKEFISYNGRYIWNDDYSSYSWNSDAGLVAPATADEWNTITYTFNTGAYDDYVVILNPNVEWVYLNQFTLTEKEVTTTEYFENPNNWVMYNSESSDPTFSLSETDKIVAKNPGSWPDITNNTTTKIDGAQSVDFFAQNKVVTIKLPDGLKANEDYTLSFSYYTPDLKTSSVAFNPLSLCTTEIEDHGFWYNYPGVLYYKGDNVTYTSTTGKDKQNTQYPASGGNFLATTAGEWHDVTISFNTGKFIDFNLVLLSKVEHLYLDNFSLTCESDEPVTPPTTEEYFETPSNWRAEQIPDATQVSEIGSNSASWVQFSNSTTQTNESNQSLYVKDSSYQLIDIPLPALAQNKNYILSFDYYSDTDENISLVFERAGLYVPAVGGSSVNPFTFPANGYLSHIGEGNVSYTSATAGENDREWGDLTLSGVSAKTWNTLNIPFYSGTFSEIVLLLKTNHANVYLDNFALTEYKPPQTTEEYFEDPTNWILDDFVDKSQEAGATIGYAPSTWRKVTSDTTRTDSSATSLRVDANNGFTSIYLPGELKENTDYTLSFTYYFDAADLKNLGSGVTGVFDRYGIYAADATNACFKWSEPGFINYISYNGSYTTKDFVTREWPGQNTSVKEGGKWIKVQIPFNTVTFKKLALVFQTKVDTLWMDNFALTEGQPVEETFHDGAKEQIIIDFEREWDYIDVKSSSRMQVAETTGKDGKATTALQIYEGEYTDSDGVTFINWQTVNGGTDKVFSIPVKGGQTYEFKVDVKMSDYDEETDQRLLLYADYATSTTLMAMVYYAEESAGVGDGWKTYTWKFTTADDATVASFGLNAGLKHPEIWVDNLTLTETEPDPPFHDGNTDPVIIDFEREYNYFTGVHANRMEVAETTGMDGKTTKALHIFEGDYIDTDQVTFVNWSAVITDSDPVFTVPVKGRTPYKISAKVKIEEWKNVDRSRLFLLYYDYNNRDTNDKSLVRGTYATMMGDGWVEYSIEFITDPGQTSISFGLNAGLSHPEIWVDDITIDAYERGLMGETEATYVEDGFNLITENGYKAAGTVTKKTVMEVPVTELTKFTMGITASGSGKMHLAFEKDGSDIIETIDVSKKETRYGYDFFTGEYEDFVYVIFEPSGSGIAYEELYLFASRAVSFGTDMGLTENPNTEKTPTYTIKYVGADDAIGVALQEGNSDSDSDSTSPETGESGLIYALFAVALTAAGALLMLGRKSRKHE